MGSLLLNKGDTYPTGSVFGLRDIFSRYSLGPLTWSGFPEEKIVNFALPDLYQRKIGMIPNTNPKKGTRRAPKNVKIIPAKRKTPFLFDSKVLLENQDQGRQTMGCT